MDLTKAKSSASQGAPLMGPKGSVGSVKPRLTRSRELEMKSTLQELLIYLIFLTDLIIFAQDFFLIFILVTFGMVTTNMYYLNKVMGNLFLETPMSETDPTTFRSLTSVYDFWKFAKGPLLDGLYWNLGHEHDDLSTLVHTNSSHIYYENLLLGVSQVRQIKIRNNTCSVYPSFQAFLKVCYGGYSFKNEDKESFGLKNSTEWHYTSSPTLTPWHWGLIGLYSSEGFRFNLPKSKNASLQKLIELHENNWISRGTRVVFIDFAMYNANVNLFCVVRLVVEFPATGGALPSWQFFSVKLLRYVTYYDYFLASCEVIFCLFIFTFIIQEIIKIRKLKKEYFQDLWSWLDILLLMLSVFAIAFNVYRTSEVSRLMESLLSNSDTYPDFYFLAFWQTRYNNMISVNVFFAWIKIFKYISFNKTMTQLSSTLSRCAKDIIGFAIMFFIVFFAYAQLGYLVFGSQVEEFSTFQNCIFTQFRIVLGDFNFASIEQANRILGPIYFITFVFFVFFVLLNMFLAIINDTYSEVKADFSVIPDRDFEIGEFIRQSYNKALIKLRLKRASQAGDLYAVDGKERERLPSSRIEMSKQVLKSTSMEKVSSKKDKRRVQAGSSTAGLQESVSAQEFQKLTKYTAELEKQLHDVTSKLDLIIKNMPEKLEKKRK